MILTENISAPYFITCKPVRFFFDGETAFVFIRRSYCSYGAELTLYRDSDSTDTEHTLEYCGINGDYDLYAVKLILSEGLYYASARIRCDNAVYYVHSVGDEVNGELRDDISLCGKFQISVSGGEHNVSDAFAGMNMYHVFVDRFSKGGNCPLRDDARYNDDWYGGIPEYAEWPGDVLPNNTFFGGTLYGVCDKLEYIKSLGCDVIYLSPVFEAYSNHKYDTGDYNRIDSGFGGGIAFKKLCNKAHSMGMKIVLDGVFNHTGSDSVYFNKQGKYKGKGAYNSTRSKYSKWYAFKSYPDDYECWWGVKTLPRLNGTDVDVHDFFCSENGIVRKWLRAGADGWRLDVADELSDSLLDGIASAAKLEKPDAVIIGEVWEDASNKIAYGKRRKYFTGCQLDSVMNYPLRDAVISFVNSGDCTKIKSCLDVLIKHYPQKVLLNLMNFLGSHDTERIITVLGGVSGEGKCGTELSTLVMTDRQYAKAREKLKLAFALVCCCPGIPCVYYGDEAGMQGYRDPFNRRPFPWGEQDEILTSFFTEILNYRKNTEPLCKGDTDIVCAQNGTVVLKRYTNQNVYCVFNMSDDVIYFPFDGTYEAFDGCVLSQGISVESGAYSILKQI